MEASELNNLSQSILGWRKFFRTKKALQMMEGFLIHVLKLCSYFKTFNLNVSVIEPFSETLKV